MPDAFWAVARAQAQREAFAAEHLETRGFEVFLPLVETRRSVDVLLRGYCFVENHRSLAFGRNDLRRPSVHPLRRHTGQGAGR